MCVVIIRPKNPSFIDRLPRKSIRTGQNISNNNKLICQRDKQSRMLASWKMYTYYYLFYLRPWTCIAHLSGTNSRYYCTGSKSPENNGRTTVVDIPDNSQNTAAKFSPHGNCPTQIHGQYYKNV